MKEPWGDYIFCCKMLLTFRNKYLSLRCRVAKRLQSDKDKFDRKERQRKKEIDRIDKDFFIVH